MWVYVKERSSQINPNNVFFFFFPFKKAFRRTETQKATETQWMQQKMIF